jgi:DNA-binding NarL/FixJ family response regulator
MDEEKITIAIADDHSILREGLRAALETDSSIEIVGEADDGDKIIELAKEKIPQIIIMDINMPTVDGIKASKEIKNFNPDIKILILTMYDHKNFILDALTAGVDGYIMKMSKIQLVFKAIYSLIDGGTYYEPNISKWVFYKLKNKANQRQIGDYTKNEFYGLSDREMEVIKLVVSGFTAIEIADKLNVSKNTIHKHKNNILQKLNLKNSAELVRFAFIEGLIDEIVED